MRKKLIFASMLSAVAIFHAKANETDHTGESVLKMCYGGKASDNNNQRGLCTGYINAVIDMALATGQICEINFDPKNKRMNSPNAPNVNADYYHNMVDASVTFLANADKETLSRNAAVIILNRLRQDFPCYHGKQRRGTNE
jgi:Rap1a immunity proteins